jgi:hypothetical protein
MPSLRRFYLCACCIDDGGFVTLVSALEKRTTLQILNVTGNHFGEQGLIALAKSLPNIKGLWQIDLTENSSFQSTLPLLLEGFRKNTSLVKVPIDIAGFAHRGLVTRIEVLGSAEPIHSSTESLAPSRCLSATRYLVPSADQGSDRARRTLSRSSQQAQAGWGRWWIEEAKA